MEPKDSPYYLGNRDVPPTVLSLKHHNSVINIELPWDVGLDDLMDAFVGACVGITFDQQMVLRYMRDYAEDRIPEEKYESPEVKE